MELQSVCSLFPSLKLMSSTKPCLSRQIVSASTDGFGDQRVCAVSASRGHWTKGFKSARGQPFEASLSRVVVCASRYNTDPKSEENKFTNRPIRRFDQVEPFRGKSGSVSFHGLTHQVVEEGKLVSAPFTEGTTSLLWVLAPVALMSSFLLPPLLLSNFIDAIFKDQSVAELLVSFSTDLLFYVGLAVFLFLTDHVQRPYMEFSSKRWGLITGLKGYMSSAFFTMGIKVLAPVLVLYVTWPVLGLPALVAVSPFLSGCGVQFVFEIFIDKRGAACWPLVPIIFEVYRLYQLTKATHFIERLLFPMRQAFRPMMSPEVLDRNGALVGLVVTFQVVGIFCLWSLITFLMRLFPSRPVAENY